ncbi:MAG: hypothetical protein NC307_15540 [Roseburia sp.]|nr:hypothetical protein [Roseburia sp.]
MIFFNNHIPPNEAFLEQIRDYFRMCSKTERQRYVTDTDKNKEGQYTEESAKKTADAMTVKEAERFADKRIQTAKIKEEKNCMDSKEVFDFLNAVIEQTKDGTLKWIRVDSGARTENKGSHAYEAVTRHGSILIKKQANTCCYGTSLHIAKEVGEYHDILGVYSFWGQADRDKAQYQDLQDHIEAIYTLIHERRMKHVFKNLYEGIVRREDKSTDE